MPHRTFLREGLNRLTRQQLSAYARFLLSCIKNIKSESPLVFASRYIGRHNALLALDELIREADKAKLSDRYFDKLLVMVDDL